MENLKSRRQFLGELASQVSAGIGILTLSQQVEAAGMVGPYVATADKVKVLQNMQGLLKGVSYLRYSDRGNLPQCREVKMAGLPSGCQIGESDQCPAVVKTLCGAPGTAKWRRGRQAIGGKLPRGTAIATFLPDQTYSQKGSGHCGIFWDLNNGLGIVDQNWGAPSIVRLHTLTGKLGDKYDPSSYYEVVAVP